MLKDFYLKWFIETRITFILKRANANDWEVVSELIQKWKKDCSSGEIKPKERRAEVEVCKIIA